MFELLELDAGNGHGDVLVPIERAWEAWGRRRQCAWGARRRCEGNLVRALLELIGEEEGGHSSPPPARLSRPWAMAAAVGSLMMRSTLRPIRRRASWSPATTVVEAGRDSDYGVLFNSLPRLKNCTAGWRALVKQMESYSMMLTKISKYPAKLTM